jgi:RNA polymerase sigma-70 factor, ECF subfamily
VERWVRRLAGPRADVEDLLHDVFVIALRKDVQWPPERDARTWLFRITHNVILTRRRNERVRRWLFARYQDQDEVSRQASPATPADEVERRDNERRLYAALDRLPDTYRTALILYELEGLSGEEIATLLGIQINALWVRLHRARARLQAALQREVER